MLTPYQTTTLPKWMFSPKLFFKSSLLLTGQCSIQERTPNQQRRPLLSLLYPQRWLLCRLYQFIFCPTVLYSVYCIIVYTVRLADRQLTVYSTHPLLQTNCHFIFNPVISYSQSVNLFSSHLSPTAKLSTYLKPTVLLQPNCQLIFNPPFSYSQLVNLFSTHCSPTAKCVNLS